MSNYTILIQSATLLSEVPMNYDKAGYDDVRDQEKEEVETQTAIDDLRGLLSHADHINTRLTLLQFLEQQAEIIKSQWQFDQALINARKNNGIN